MPAKVKGSESKSLTQPSSKVNVAHWLTLGILGVVLVLVAAFVVERSVSSRSSSTAAEQITTLDARSASDQASPSIVNGELHEPQDLAAAEAGRLGQPALVWFGASW